MGNCVAMLTGGNCALGGNCVADSVEIALRRLPVEIVHSVEIVLWTRWKLCCDAYLEGGERWVASGREEEK